MGHLILHSGVYWQAASFEMDQHIFEHPPLYFQILLIMGQPFTLVDKFALKCVWYGKCIWE